MAKRQCVGPRKLTQDEWVERAREVHGNRYDYSKTAYLGATKPVTIRCPQHGEFNVSMATQHLCQRYKRGCKKCRSLWNDYQRLVKRKDSLRACEICQKYFVPTNDRPLMGQCQRVCSFDCAGKLRTRKYLIDSTCASCGKQIKKKASRVKRYNKVYCGDACRINDRAVGEPLTYFIQEGEDGPIKIGFTSKLLKARLQELQCGNSSTLEVRHVIHGNKEQELHERFARNRIRGEWFHPSEELLQLISQPPP